jgi:hypothetical protein
MHLEPLHPYNYRLWYVKSEATFDVSGLILSIVNGSKPHAFPDLLDPRQQTVAFSKLSELSVAIRKAIQNSSIALDSHAKHCSMHSHQPR